jgi:hypothetical protein
MRHGSFWYPARLLSREEICGATQWRVQPWKGCLFVSPGIDTTVSTLVAEEDLVDELWGDREGRRKIRVRGALFLLENHQT